MTCVNHYLRVERRAGALVTVCRCGHVVGPAERNFKELVLEARFPIQHLGPQVDPHRLGDELEAREFYCPACALLLDTEVSHRDDPILRDVELELNGTSIEREEQAWATSSR